MCYVISCYHSEVTVYSQINNDKTKLLWLHISWQYLAAAMLKKVQTTEHFGNHIQTQGFIAGHDTNGKWDIF